MKRIILCFMFSISIFGCAKIQGDKLLKTFIDGVPSQEELAKEKAEKKLNSIAETVAQQEAGWTYHAPYKAGQCAICHNLESGGSNMLIGERLADICFKCHDKNLFTGENIHGPVKMGACQLCHNAHATPEKKLLKFELSQLCANCHIDKKDFKHFPKEKGLGISEIGSCTVCHKPHSGEAGLLKFSEKETCMQCHQPDPNETNMQKKMMWNFPKCVGCHKDIHHLEKKEEKVGE